MTSDAGVFLLREVDRKLGLTMETIRRENLQKTELAQAQIGTIRLKLLKIGAVVIRNTRRIKLSISSHYPYQDLFKNIALNLVSTA